MDERLVMAEEETTTEDPDPDDAPDDEEDEAAVARFETVGARTRVELVRPPETLA